MRLTSIISGTILAALGFYAYFKSADIMEIITQSSGISTAMLTILGTDGSSILLATQIVGATTLVAGFIVILHGLVWPERNKPVKDVQEVKMEFTINQKAPKYHPNDGYTHTISPKNNDSNTGPISSKSNDPYEHSIRRAEMRDPKIS